MLVLVYTLINLSNYPYLPYFINIKLVDKTKYLFLHKNNL